METSNNLPSANVTKDGTEETALLARGGQEVSSLDSCKEEDDLLSSMPQEATGENPIEGVSPVASGPSSNTKLTGSPATKGADPPTRPSLLVEASEPTATLALTLEHQAEVHSADAMVGSDAAALTALQGLPFIKPEPKDPLPVKFTGNLRVIDDELEIVDFVPA